MSRMFDEVMGLGNFADSSRGSVASSKSGGQTEAKGLEETSGQKLTEDSNCSRREEKTDEGLGETIFPRLASSSSDQLSSFNLKRGGGEAAFDDALDGLPQFGPEEEDEDWHFALPLGSLEDVDLGKANSKTGQFGPENSTSRCNAFARKPPDNEEEEQQRQEKDGSGDSVKTYDSSQDNTPDNSRGKSLCELFDAYLILMSI